MSIFVLLPSADHVAGVIHETSDGWNGTAFIAGRPVPIGARATRDRVLERLVSLVRDDGIKTDRFRLQEIKAKITILPG